MRDSEQVHRSNAAEAGKAAGIKVPTKTGDRLYLIMATTPDIFKGWDRYQYKLKIYPVQTDQPNKPRMKGH